MLGYSRTKSININCGKDCFKQNVCIKINYDKDEKLTRVETYQQKCQEVAAEVLAEWLVMQVRLVELTGHVAR